MKTPSGKPRHFGKLDGATHEAEGINPLCGDKLHLYLRVEDDAIVEATFEGTGCAISVASASLLTDMVTGRDTGDAERLFDDVTASLTGNENRNDTDLGKLKALEGVREFPSRVKCATLAWHALHSAIRQYDKPATTE